MQSKANAKQCKCKAVQMQSNAKAKQCKAMHNKAMQSNANAKQCKRKAMQTQSNAIPIILSRNQLKTKNDLKFVKDSVSGLTLGSWTSGARPLWKL